MTRKIAILTLCLSFVLFCFSCNFFNTQNKNNNSKIIAKVYNNILYENEIPQLNFKENNEQDSLAVFRKFVDDWLRKNVVIYQANEQLKKEELSVIENKIQDYKESLITYAYEKALIFQKMDTIIKDSEILKFYNEHKEDFKAQEYFINIKYMILPAEVSEYEQIEEWFKEIGKDSGVIEELQDVAFKYNAPYNLIGQWFKYDTFVEKFRVKTSRGPEKFLKNNTDLYYTDSLNTYLIGINKYTLIGDYLDPVYCSDDIKTLLLNVRQKEFLKKTKENIYKEAVDKNKIQIYYEQD